MNSESQLRPSMPLPGDVWRATDESGERYFQHAIDVLEKSVEFAVATDRLPDWSEKFVKDALYAALTRQADRTGQITSIANPPVHDERWHAMLDGKADPDELVALWRDLGPERRNKVGIEVARLTHVGIWDIKNTLTTPVYSSIVNDLTLHTRLIEGQPFYKLFSSDKVSKDGEEYSRGEIVERKKLVATYCGDPYGQNEQLWMMRRDMMLVDFEGINRTIENDNGAMSNEAKQAAALRSAINKAKSHDRDKRVVSMNTALEPILAQPIDFRPRYLRPLLTTMYLKDPAENVRPKAV